MSYSQVLIVLIINLVATKAAKVPYPAMIMLNDN